MSIEQQLIFRLALSNLLYRERIMSGGESFTYWIDRLMDANTAELQRRKES